MILGAEDVAAGPGNLGTEGSKGLDEDGSLDGPAGGGGGDSAAEMTKNKDWIHTCGGIRQCECPSKAEICRTVVSKAGRSDNEAMTR